MHFHKYLLVLFILFSTFLSADEADSAKDLKKLSLEDLFQLEVSTSGRKPEPISRAASAIEVLTAERIRRSGATTIPDLLRQAGGVNVARFDSRTWAISARGLNLNTSNKLQVLMDGRVLYTPLFSGVFWDVQDTILDDLDRIEIVRGPGATLWGANALNGVINILSQNARFTQGTLIQTGIGNEERGFINARHGGQLRNSLFYRGYFKFFARDGLVFSDGKDAEDDWLMGRGGFRIDSKSTGDDSYTIQGDVYRGSLNFPDREDGTVAGGNLLGRWTRYFSPSSDLHVQLYYDRSDRKIPNQFQEERNTFDFEMHHHFQPGIRNDLVWGFNYRASADDTQDIGTAQFEPSGRTIHWLSAFLQDEFQLKPDKFAVILGSKFEKNTFTDLEVQPNVRFVFTPDPDNTIWGAVSRAVRVPTRIDVDFRFFPVPGVLAIEGNPDFKPEELFSVEGGYRVNPSAKVYVDVTAFYHFYDSLITVEPRAPGEPAIIGNGMNADIYGATLAGNVQPQRRIRIIGSISLLHKTLQLDPDSHDISSAVGEGNDPNYYWQLHSLIDPQDNIQLDLILRSSDDLPAPPVPGYVDMDFRIGWQVSRQLEFSVVGQNLFQRRHPEFGPDTPLRKEVERSFYGRVSWVF